MSHKSSTGFSLGKVLWPFQIAVTSKCFYFGFIFAVEELYICQLNIEVYLDAIMVSAGRILVFLNTIMIHFRNIFPSVLTLYSLALYSNVCC